jgi:hypothetical protein
MKKDSLGTAHAKRIGFLGGLPTSLKLQGNPESKQTFETVVCRANVVHRHWI